MTKRLSLEGQRFGHLVVLEYAYYSNGGLWRCVCDCGNTKLIRSQCLKHGQSSCGCDRALSLSHPGTANPSFKHGRSHTVEYATWGRMIQRCSNQNDLKNWKLYGGRGIKVCDRWQGEHGFENFFADIGLRPTKNHSLDRINNDGNYEPGNVRWATDAEQNNNRRCNRKVKAA